MRTASAGNEWTNLDNWRIGNYTYSPCMVPTDNVLCVGGTNSTNAIFYTCEFPQTPSVARAPWKQRRAFRRPIQHARPAIMHRVGLSQQTRHAEAAREGVPSAVHCADWMNQDRGTNWGPNTVDMGAPGFQVSHLRAAAAQHARIRTPASHRSLRVAGDLTELTGAAPDPPSPRSVPQLYTTDVAVSESALTRALGRARWPWGVPPSAQAARQQHTPISHMSR